jgi:two-component system NarL family sensor kinase
LLKLFFLLFISNVPKPAGLLLLILFVTGGQSYAQNKTIDSLQSLLQKDKPDTSKVIHLNELSSEYKIIGNYAIALQYANAGLQIARQLNFQKGISSSYIKLGNIYQAQGSYDKALEDYRIVLRISEEIDDKSRVANAYNNIGTIYYSQGSYDKALENHLASLKIRKVTGDKKGIAASYSNIGNIYLAQGSYDKALENYFASMKMWESLGDKENMTVSYNNIGIVYRGQGNYNKALENYFVSLRIFEKIGDKQKIASCYNNLGVVYAAQGNHDKALKNHLASLKISEEINDKYGIAGSYNNIGDIYMHNGRTDLALKNYFASLNIFEDIVNKQGMTISYISIGQSYTDKLNYKEASVWLQKAQQLAKKIGSMPLLLDAYMGLSKAGEKMSDYRNAYHYHQLYFQLKDSLFNEKSNKQVAELQTKYETEKKEKENKLLIQQSLLQEARIEKRTLVMIILVGMLVFAISIFIFIYTRYKLKQKALMERELSRQQQFHFREIINAEEKERRRVAQELHDGLGQLLSTTKLNISILEGRLPSTETPIKNALSLIDNAIDEVRTISHNMMPSTLIRLGLTSTLRELARIINNSNKIKVELNVDYDERLSDVNEVTIYRIIQESVNNVIKYSKASCIKSF